MLREKEEKEKNIITTAQVNICNHGFGFLQAEYPGVR